MTVAEALWARKWLLAAVTAGSAGLAALVSLTLPSTFRATATVLLSPPAYRSDVSPTAPSAETYKEIATTPAVVLGALKGADLADDPVSWTHDRALRRMRVETYEERGQFNTVLLSPILGLAVTDTDPQRAARLANAWAASFQALSRSFKGQGAHRLAEVLEERVTLLASRLGEAEEALRRFEEENRLPVLRQEARVRAEALAEAVAARLEAEAGAEALRGVLGALRRQVAPPPGEAGILEERGAAAEAGLLAAQAALREARQELRPALLEAEIERTAATARFLEERAREAEDRRTRAQAEVERLGTLLQEALATAPVPALASPGAGAGDQRAGGSRALESEPEERPDPAVTALRERYYEARLDSETLGPLVEEYRRRAAAHRQELATLEADRERIQDRLDRLEASRNREEEAVGTLNQAALAVREDLTSVTLTLQRREAEAAAARGQEERLRREAEAAHLRLAKAEIRRARLDRDLALLQEVHGRLVGKAQEAQAAEASEASDVVLVSEAAVPDDPVSPRPLWNVAVAAVFGLLASATLVVLTQAPAGPGRG